MTMRIWAALFAVMTACGVASAAETFPERQRLEGKDYVIEYSAGDEAYAQALAKQLPLKLSPAAQPADDVPLTVAVLRTRRAEVLKLIAQRLALPAPTPKMGSTFDAFVAGYLALQAAPVIDTAKRFALWRKPELMTRLKAGENVAGFARTADGDIEFSAGASFEFRDGEPPKTSIARMREDWRRVVWPLKIGEGSASPDEEINQRLVELRENAAQLDAFQSAGVQRMAVVTVLHETVESTLVSTYIRSPDRRWFCEGVANYVAYGVIEAMVGMGVARAYYDVDAEVRRFAALKPSINLAHWPVVEDPRSKDVPADVNTASYAFATRAIFAAFGDPKAELLPKVLTELRKTPLDRANIEAVYAAYHAQSGKDLHRFLGAE